MDEAPKKKGVNWDQAVVSLMGSKRKEMGLPRPSRRVPIRFLHPLLDLTQVTKPFRALSSPFRNPQEDTLSHLDREDSETVPRIKSAFVDSIEASPPPNSHHPPATSSVLLPPPPNPSPLHPLPPPSPRRSQEPGCRRRLRGTTSLTAMRTRTTRCTRRTMRWGPRCCSWGRNGELLKGFT